MAAWQPEVPRRGALNKCRRRVAPPAGTAVVNERVPITIHLLHSFYQVLRRWCFLHQPMLPVCEQICFLALQSIVQLTYALTLEEVRDLNPSWRSLCAISNRGSSQDGPRPTPHWVRPSRSHECALRQISPVETCGKPTICNRSQIMPTRIETAVSKRYRSRHKRGLNGRVGRRTYRLVACYCGQITDVSFRFPQLNSSDY
ncbi:hypothetical protein LX36DRAFT_200283 [Colletotrichum falcatum]|nr:hypothetical protein LX36DRAFT_200283 [Colletotrichum falcatum]